MDVPQITASEAGKALDALAALSVELSCHCNVPPDTLILPRTGFARPAKRLTKPCCR
jgi:hypothetical protein